MVYELRKKAEKELLNHIAPFWLKLIDNENGGYDNITVIVIKNI